jgi:exodeoxyribonuclease V gamma subunit
VGRNVRDNSEQPPSVLVSQLCDYLRAGWQLDLARRTTEHALQPFSRRYFEQDGLLTFAGEWRAAHADAALDAAAALALPPYELDQNFRLKLGTLASMLRQPVRYFFRQRLGVVFGDTAVVGEDEEPFALDGLQRYQLEEAMLDDSGAQEELEQVDASLAQRAQRLGREGVLPIGLIGERLQAQLVADLVPVRSAWLTLCQQYPQPAPKLALKLTLAGLQLEDWLDQLRSDGNDTAWLMQMPSRVCDKGGALRADKLIPMWLRQLAAAAQGLPVTGFLVARDAIVVMLPLEQGPAYEVLADLVRIWRDGMDRPLPVACKTALALVRGLDARTVYDGGFELRGENEDLCLARLWPDFAALSAQPEFADCSMALYQPLVDWIDAAVTITPIEGEQA